MRSFASLAVDVFAVTDTIVTACIFALVWGDDLLQSKSSLVFALLAIPLWTVLFRVFGVYDSHRVKEIRDVRRTIVAVHVPGVVLLGLFAWGLEIPGGVVDSLRFSLFSCAVAIGERWLLYGTLRWVRRRGHDVHQVCVV